MDAEAVADAIASQCMDELTEAIENDTLDEYINSSMVVLNGFQFCKVHGNEFCAKCEGDTRFLNNEELPKATYTRLKSSIWAGIDPRKRPPICDVYARFNPIPTGEIHPFRRSELYACEPHREIDCERCFDWVKILQGKEKKEGAVADRGQILRLLGSMGVELPPNTKMKDNVLEKKLSGALTAAQSLSSFGPSSLNPLELQLWTGTGKASAFEAMWRGSMTESLRVYENNLAGKPNTAPLYENAFMDARQTCKHFAYHFAAGRKSLVLKDKDDKQAICIRLLEIYKLDKDTPLISLIYETASYNGPHNTLDFIRHLVDDGAVPQINATVEEQALFHRLLVENARRVSISYKPKKERYEKTFKPSFVVPMGPLSQIDIGRLTHNTGCEICGNKTTSRCSQCQSTSYCGPVCQKAHWPEHKTMCKSLKGGTWQTIKFHTNIRVDGQLQMYAYINHHGPVDYTVEGKSDEVEVPVNVHGDQAFLIKLQRRLSQQEMDLPFVSPESRMSDGHQSILVYDRQRSFRAHVWDFTNVGVYEQVLGHIWAEENQKKMYRWAKRVGDHELSVCLDRSPVPVPTW